MVEKKTTTKAKPKKATKATTGAKKTVSASEKRIEELKQKNKVLSDKVSDLLSENKSLDIDRKTKEISITRLKAQLSSRDTDAMILEDKLSKYKGKSKKYFMFGLVAGLSLMILASLIS